MTINLEHTPVFTWNWEALKDDKIRFIFNQGGSRSSKTYSLCQIVIMFCLLNPGKGVSVVRKTFPALRSSIMRDFFTIMKDMDIYYVNNHNKTENVYTFDNGSWVEFFSADDEQKLRGRKRDLLFCNEGNELNFEDFNQLVMRTTGKVIVDFNPSDTDHWVYDIMDQDNSMLIKSTYLDNPFLEKDQIEYIENLINVDENYYKIYALGERPISTTRIYNHFKQYVDEIECNDIVYGFDHGFNHPSALVECKFIDNKVYVKELLYESKLTISDMIRKMKDMSLDKRIVIFCDSARPEIIEDFRRAGYNAKGSDKAVKPGIDKVKSMEVYIHYESINILKESKLYSWKTINNVITDEPIKMNDDAMDAMRYAIFNRFKNMAPKRTPFYIG
jgi:phage terminase large subunit